MNKFKLNYLIDGAMLIMLLAIILSLFSRNFRNLHETSGYLLLILVGFHFLLHIKIFWNGIKNMFNIDKKI
jgi:uncharacterized membrane protein YkvI